jgi:ribonuclease HI
MLLAMECSLMEASQKPEKPRMKGDLSELKKMPMSKDKNEIPGWSPPPPGWTKINIDGSFLPETGDAGVSVIARDSRGRILFSAWSVLRRCAGVVEAEAQACIEGLRLATRLTPGMIILESDCAHLVKSLKGKEDRSEIGFVVAEAKELLQVLVEWNVAQVKREGNLVAHELARLARRDGSSEVHLGRRLRA